jgi:hypothetical protein
MASLNKIRTHGFRHWYERQLIECHAWLVSCFFGIICAASGIEVSGYQALNTRLLGLTLTIAGIVLSVISWKRYHGMLAIAERLGERAVCPKCQAYAKFKVIASGPTPLPDGADPEIDRLGEAVWLQAQCRRCSHDWVI